ncbi:GNAT family N-acetyltransferase [Oleiphilus messinensis]|nr:GNAT family N-acetyltransferase [Oleiphilus messinensis]
MNIDLIEYDDRYVESAITMWRASKHHALGIADQHDLDSYRYFLTEILVPDFTVQFARETSTGQIIGIFVFNATEINQLYIHPDYQRQRIGSQFIQRAKDLCTTTLELNTFEQNLNARHFYEKHGFEIIGGDSKNEEGLPDLRYRWG